MSPLRNPNSLISKSISWFCSLYAELQQHKCILETDRTTQDCSILTAGRQERQSLANRQLPILINNQVIPIISE